MSTLARARLLVVVATCVLSLVAWAVVRDVVGTADRLRAAEDAVEHLLTSQVDQETGLRGFAQTAEEDVLEPYRTGRGAFEQAVLAADGRVPAAALTDALLAARAWQAAAAVAVADLRAGDAALAAVGGAVAASLRASDVAGRAGGEELLVLLPDTDRPGAAVAAEELRAAIADLAVPGVPVPVTASLGVATFPDDAADAAALVARADAAMYEAKRAGRDGVVSATTVGAPLRAVAAT